MDGSSTRVGTAATAAAVLTVLALVLTPSAVAQSAGDDQYADPLADGGGGQSQQQPSPQAGNGSEAESPAPTTASPDPATSSQNATTAPAQATLPHTGADARLLAGLGLTLIAVGALGLGLPGRLRHSRG